MSSYDRNLLQILDREQPWPAGTTGADTDYTVDGTACRGYLARPNGLGPHPGVLVVHDWSGVTDYVRMRADMLARLGYVAFAADIFGADVRPTPEQAPAVANDYIEHPALLRARLHGGLAQLVNEPDVDVARCAVIGYCFGGAGALELARTGADLRAAVAIHGNLTTGPAGEADQIRAKLLVLRGAADPFIDDQAVLAFENELRQAPRVDWQVHTYSGVMHAFTIPGVDAPEHGAKFDPVAEQRSWQAMKTFLNDSLR